MNDRYSQQVSAEQSGADRSEFAFSNGLSITSDQASRLADTHLNLPNRVTGNSLSTLYGPTSAVVRDGFSSNRESVRNAVASTSGIPHQPRYPEYVEYSDRLRSYARWTLNSPDTQSLTAAGFFYTNSGDLVRCYQCGIGLKDFSVGDDPVKEHVRNSGNCPHIEQVIGPLRLSVVKRQLQLEDPQYSRQMQWNGRHNVNPVTTNYRHPEYQKLQARLLSFGRWPGQTVQTPRQMAEAGLYYTGVEDQVRCFACDGGLGRWDPDDDPWMEHCRWFPACPFAKEQKGDDYIALIQATVASESEENESAGVRHQPRGEGGVSSRQRGEDLPGAMSHMDLREPAIMAAIHEHRSTCLEMGYQEADFNAAVLELRNKGRASLEDIIDAIETVEHRKQCESELQARQNETPLEENKRLKDIIICIACSRNNVNALFLPCTHHRLCMECAGPLTYCPICNKLIQQKVRTYLA